MKIIFSAYGNMVDLINQILMERILLSDTGCDTRRSLDSSTIAEETSQMVINDSITNNSYPQPSVLSTSPSKVCGNLKNNQTLILSTQDDCLQYLMECYERVTTVEKAYPKVYIKNT
jgi:hypothetical protein